MKRAPTILLNSHKKCKLGWKKKPKSLVSLVICRCLGYDGNERAKNCNSRSTSESESSSFVKNKSALFYKSLCTVILTIDSGSKWLLERKCEESTLLIAPLLSFVNKIANKPIGVGVQNRRPSRNMTQKSNRQNYLFNL